MWGSDPKRSRQMQQKLEIVDCNAQSDSCMLYAWLGRGGGEFRWFPYLREAPDAAAAAPGNKMDMLGK